MTALCQGSGEPYLSQVAIAFRAGLLSVCVLLVAGCSNSGITGLDVDTFDAVPTRIEFDGVSYYLSPFIWRDFSLVVGQSGGSDLFAAAVVYPVDEPEVPLICEPEVPGNSCRRHISVVESHVKNRETGEIWSTRKLESKGVYYGLESDGLEYIARGGPRWGPGILVDLVVKVRSLDGESALLRAEVPFCVVGIR